MKMASILMVNLGSVEYNIIKVCDIKDSMVRMCEQNLSLELQLQES